MKIKSPRQPSADNPADPENLSAWQLRTAQDRRSLLARVQPLLEARLSALQCAIRLGLSACHLYQLLNLAPRHHREIITSAEKCRRLLALPFHKLAPTRRQRSRTGRRKRLFHSADFLRAPQSAVAHALNAASVLIAYLLARAKGVSGYRAALAIGQSPVVCWKLERRFISGGLAALLPRYRKRAAALLPRKAIPSRVLIAQVRLFGNGAIQAGKASVRILRREA